MTTKATGGYQKKLFPYHPNAICNRLPVNFQSEPIPGELCSCKFSSFLQKTLADCTIAKPEMSERTANIPKASYRLLLL